MKTEDFKELQEFCEKKGYQLINESFEDNTKFFVVSKKKDILEGVEFFLYESRIYKLDYRYSHYLKDNLSRTFHADFCKPSTEQAYVEQLKKEALERFGEIKEGDRFIEPDGGKDTRVKNPLWGYNKLNDWLYYGSCMLYGQGKWAERVKERVKVQGIDSSGWGRNTPEWKYSFDFKISELREDAKTMNQKVLPFLASQLEKYLNKEL